MRSVKFFLRDYEQTKGERLLEFRRHINSFIEGGGTTPSKQKRDVSAIIDQLNGAAHDEYLTNLIKRIYNIPENMHDIHDIRKYLEQHPQTQKQREERMKAMADYYNSQPNPPQPLQAVVSEQEEVSFQVSPLSESHDASLSYSDEEIDDDESASLSPDASKLIDRILNNTLDTPQTPETALEQAKIRQLKYIAYFFATHYYKMKHTQRREQLQRLKDTVIKKIKHILGKSLTTRTALRILTRLVQMALMSTSGVK